MLSLVLTVDTAAVLFYAIYEESKATVAIAAVWFVYPVLVCLSMVVTAVLKIVKTDSDEPCFR